MSSKIRKILIILKFLISKRESLTLNSTLYGHSKLFHTLNVKLLSRVRLFATPWTVAHQALSPWDSPGKNTGVGCHCLLGGIFPTQGSNPGLPHCRQTP